MSETTFRLARLGEDTAIIDFINENFDMRLPLLNRPELFHHYYAGRSGIPQFAVAEEDGRYVSAAGYILANTKRKPDIWVSVWVAAKGHNGVGLELMNALPGLLNADVVACNNIRPNTCTFYQFFGLEGRTSAPLLPPGPPPRLLSGKAAAVFPAPCAARFRPCQGGGRRRPDLAGDARHAPHAPQGCVVYAAAVFPLPALQV